MDIQPLFDQFQQLLQSLQQQGWLSRNQALQLTQLESGNADQLFQSQSHRPLMVGFFGGTGVGKSSLLNRLAGVDIAKVGIQRPTSMEVSIYLHEDFKLSLLPRDIPIESTRVQYHQDKQRQLLAWVDMPDVDSTHIDNRQLVEAWLPFLDVLVYVVTPERYKDDRGWQYLSQRAQRHHWHFVMNHWDQGSAEQLEDFQQRLEHQGFLQPSIIPSSCTQQVTGDAFDQLEQNINAAIKQHGIKLLQEFGLISQLHELSERLVKVKASLAEQQQWQQLQTQCHAAIKQGQAEFQAYFMKQCQYQQQLNKNKSLPELAASFNKIADESINDSLINRLENLNQQLALLLQSKGINTELLLQYQQPATADLKNSLSEQLQQAFNKPGSLLRRFTHYSAKKLGWLLPGMGLVALMLYSALAYVKALSGEAEFLPSVFFIHSGFLLASLFGSFWLLQRWLEPNSKRVLQQACKACNKCHQQTIQHHYEQLCQQLSTQRQQNLQLLENLQASINQYLKS